MASQGFVEHYTALQRLFYIFFFRTPDVPERFFSKDNYALFDAYRLINPNRFTAEVIAEYKKAIGKPGALTAGLNYYRANLPPEVEAELASGLSFFIKNGCCLAREATPAKIPHPAPALW
jgi:hypothetical protein